MVSRGSEQSTSASAQAPRVNGVDKRLPVRDAAQIHRRIVVTQILQRLHDGDFRPALGIGFCRIFQKAVERDEKIGNRVAQQEFAGQSGGLRTEEVVPIAQGLPQRLQRMSGGPQRFDRRDFFLEGLLIHGLLREREP